MKICGCAKGTKSTKICHQKRFVSDFWRFLSLLHFYIRISELLRPSFKSFNLCKIVPSPIYRPLGYCRIIADNHFFYNSWIKFFLILSNFFPKQYQLVFLLLLKIVLLSCCPKKPSCCLVVLKNRLVVPKRLVVRKKNWRPMIFSSAPRDFFQCSPWNFPALPVKISSARKLHRNYSVMCWIRQKSPKIFQK